MGDWYEEKEKYPADEGKIACGLTVDSVEKLSNLLALEEKKLQRMKQDVYRQQQIVDKLRQEQFQKQQTIILQQDQQNYCPEPNPNLQRPGQLEQFVIESSESSLEEYGRSLNGSRSQEGSSAGSSKKGWKSKSSAEESTGETNEVSVGPDGVIITTTLTTTESLKDDDKFSSPKSNTGYIKNSNLADALDASKNTNIRTSSKNGLPDGGADTRATKDKKPKKRLSIEEKEKLARKKDRALARVTDEAESDMHNSFDWVGVAKCGRCGLRLPLDVEVIEKHGLECEKNYIPLKPGERSSNHFVNVVKSSIGDWISDTLVFQNWNKFSSSGGDGNPPAPIGSPPSSGNAVASSYSSKPDTTTGSEDDYIRWLRHFHNEFSEERFLKNKDRLASGFRELWEESLRDWGIVNGNTGMTEATQYLSSTTAIGENVDDFQNRKPGELQRLQKLSVHGRSSASNSPETDSPSRDMSNSPIRTLSNSKSQFVVSPKYANCQGLNQNPTRVTNLLPMDGDDGV